MLRFIGKKSLPIGLDLGAEHLRALQLRAREDGLQVIAAACTKSQDVWSTAEPLNGKKLGPALEQMFRQGGFEGREVVVALPREMVKLTNLRLPVMPPAELRSTVEFEAHRVGEAAGLSRDRMVFDYLNAGEVRQGTDSRLEVMMVTAARDDVDSFVETMHSAGVQTVSLEFEPVALYRSVEKFVRRRDDETQVNVLIDIGRRCTQVLIGRGRDISFIRTLDVGGSKLNEAVARRLGITAEEATTLRQRLAATHAMVDVVGRDPVRQTVFDTLRPVLESLGREIAMCLRYHSVTFRGQRPHKLRLVGGESTDPAVREILESIVPVPLDPHRPLSNVDVSAMKPADREGDLAGWTTALGLSMRRVSGTYADRGGISRQATQAVNLRDEALSRMDLPEGAPTPRSAATASTGASVDIESMPAEPVIVLERHDA